MSSTMNFSYMPAYSSMLGRQGGRDIDYLMGSGHDDGVGGINPLSLPSSSLTSPSPDPNQYYSNRFASVSPSEGAGPLSNTSLSYVNDGGSGDGAGSHSTTHTAPPSSHGLSRLEIDAATAGSGGAAGSGTGAGAGAVPGSGPASAAGPSSASYSQNRFAFNLNPTDPALRALYSASPDHFAFNMGYSQPQASSSSGLSQAQAQRLSHQAASGGQHSHQNGASSVPGPSRTGSSGSITGLGSMTSMAGVARGGMDIAALSGRSSNGHGRSQQHQQQQQDLAGYPDPNSYLDGLDLDLEDDKLKVVQMPMSSISSINSMGLLSDPSSTSAYAQMQRHGPGQGHDPLDLDVNMHNMGAPSGQGFDDQDEQGEDGRDQGRLRDGEEGDDEQEQGEEDGEVDNEEPLYVNAKQYHRILKRRMARARLEELNRLSRSRKPYLHESRHRHACSRPRGKGGRFLTADEIEALKKQQEAEGEGESTRGQSEGSD